MSFQSLLTEVLLNIINFSGSLEVLALRQTDQALNAHVLAASNGSGFAERHSHCCVQATTTPTLLRAELLIFRRLVHPRHPRLRLHFLINNFRSQWLGDSSRIPQLIHLILGCPREIAGTIVALETDAHRTLTYFAWMRTGGFTSAFGTIQSPKPNFFRRLHLGRDVGPDHPGPLGGIHGAWPHLRRIRLRGVQVPHITAGFSIVHLHLQDASLQFLWRILLEVPNLIELQAQVAGVDVTENDFTIAHQHLEEVDLSGPQSLVLARLLRLPALRLLRCTDYDIGTRSDHLPNLMEQMDSDVRVVLSPFPHDISFIYPQLLQSANKGWSSDDLTCEAIL
ncbi:hypothetical protein B0H13DRAFT_2337088 [Mycena leptocephala]|nr:hypothetical protein B0H13DRAFT_2337088 [Mycena leptocephala]